MVQDVEAVAPAYELDDLDDEWKELLSELDARLLTVSPQCSLITGKELPGQMF